MIDTVAQGQQPDGEHLGDDVGDQHNVPRRSAAGAVGVLVRPATPGGASVPVIASSERRGFISHSPIIPGPECQQFHPWLALSLIATTGGTISTSADDHGVKRPTRTGADLTSGLDVQVIDLMAVDSSMLTLADWDRISATVNTVSDVDGVVITHGTDASRKPPLWLELTCRRPTSPSCSPAHSAAPTHPTPTVRPICATLSRLPPVRRHGVSGCW